MSIETAVCSAYMASAMAGQHSASDRYRVALIKPNSNGRHGVMTSTYGDLGPDELQQSMGYETGGADVRMLKAEAGASGAVAGFDDAVWPVAHFAAAGALLYNASKGGAAVAVLDFGGAFVGGGGQFVLPLADVIAAQAAV